jgi:hypothetical protein
MWHRTELWWLKCSKQYVLVVYQQASDIASCALLWVRRVQLSQNHGGFVVGSRFDGKFTF